MKWAFLIGLQTVANSKVGRVVLLGYGYEYTSYKRAACVVCHFILSR